MPKRFKVLFIVIGICVVLATAFLVVTVSTREKITFHDAAFEASIKKALNKDDVLYSYDLMFINSLTILSNEVCFINRDDDVEITDTGCIHDNNEITSYGDIASLEDLKYFPNLKEVRVVNNMVTAIPYYAENTIEKMNLSHNFISDVGNINQYTSLKTLNLSYNMLNDINALLLPDSVQMLDISSNAIRHAAILADAKNLTSLAIRKNYMKDISFLTSLSDLALLDISHNEIDSLAAIKPLTHLTNLNISFNEIATIENLSSGRSLRILNAMNNQISRVDSNFEHVRQVNLSNNALTGVFDLSIFPEAENILLDFNQITDINNSSHTRIKTMSISFNILNNLDFLKYQTEISLLDIAGNPISDILYVSQYCPMLTHLNISGTNVNDIASLNDCKELTTLIAFDVDADFRAASLSGTDIVK